MSAPQDKNVSFELTAVQDDTRYLVQQHQEILRILRGLAHRHEMVSAFFNDGKELLLTVILDVDAEANRIILDCGANETLNKRILQATKIIFVTSLDGVKIQFVTNAIQPTTHAGRDAFSTNVPNQVLRLQRREYYRLTTPIVNPLKCEIPLGNGEKVEVPVADIGGGGIGMMIGHPPGFTLEVGTVFPGCRIHLPGIGTVETTLRIQSVFEVTLKNGNKVLRSGCQFIELRPAMQSMIQRYIIKLERERITNS